MDRTNSAASGEAQEESEELREEMEEPGDAIVETSRKKRKTENAKPKGKSPDKNSGDPGPCADGDAPSEAEEGNEDAGASNSAPRKGRKAAEAHEAHEAPDDVTDCDCAPCADDAYPNASSKDDLAAERDRYLRLAAEYDNFRKRSIKERETAYSNSRADTVTRLLPVYDNLERALKMECADEAFYKGVELTMTGFCEILEGMDVKPIDAVGEPFDPNRHNAVMSIDNPELGEKIVAEEFQKGFTLGERVIRFSTVVVAN